MTRPASSPPSAFQWFAPSVRSNRARFLDPTEHSTPQTRCVRCGKSSRTSSSPRSGWRTSSPRTSETPNFSSPRRLGSGSTRWPRSSCSRRSSSPTRFASATTVRRGSTSSRSRPWRRSSRPRGVDPCVAWRSPGWASSRPWARASPLIWTRLREGRTGLRPLTLFSPGGPGCAPGGRGGRRAGAQRAEALAPSGWHSTPPVRHWAAGAFEERGLLALGTTTGGILESETALPEAPRRCRCRGPRAAPPSPARHGDRRPRTGPGALRGGAHVLHRLLVQRQCHRLRRGDRVRSAGGWALVGGVDSLSRLTYAGFHSLSCCRARPAARSTGIAAACRWVREPLSSCSNRKSRPAGAGAPILGFIAGWGCASDAHHPTAPHPRGRRCGRGDRRVRWPTPGCAPPRWTTSTPTGPRHRPTMSAEGLALERVFGANGPLTSSTKGLTGHTLGAAGAIEAVLSLLALSSGFVPATDRARGSGPGDPHPARSTGRTRPSALGGGLELVRIRGKQHRPGSLPETRRDAHGAAASAWSDAPVADPDPRVERLPRLERLAFSAVREALEGQPPPEIARARLRDRLRRVGGDGGLPPERRRRGAWRYGSATAFHQSVHHSSGRTAVSPARDPRSGPHPLAAGALGGGSAPGRTHAAGPRRAGAGRGRRRADLGARGGIPRLRGVFHAAEGAAAVLLGPGPGPLKVERCELFSHPASARRFASPARASVPGSQLRVATRVRNRSCRSPHPPPTSSARSGPSVGPEVRILEDQAGATRVGFHPSAGLVRFVLAARHLLAHPGRPRPACSTGSRSAVVSRSRSCGMTPEAIVTTGALGLVGTGLGAARLWGVLHPRATLFGPVVWRGPGNRAEVALTFDDGPHPEYTARIAEILSKERGQGDVLLRRRAASSDIRAWPLLSTGPVTHWRTTASPTGPDVTSSSAGRLSQRISTAARTQSSASPRHAPRYYRPAVGIRNPVVHRAARAVGTRGRHLDSRRPRRRSLPSTYRRAQRMGTRAHAGEHPRLARRRSPRSAPAFREQTVRSLPELLRALEATEG